MVKKDLILKHKLFPSLKTKEDYVLWLKISKSGIIFYGIKKVLTNWTDRKNSLSKSLIQKLKDGFKVYYSYEKFNFLESLFRLIILSINFLKKIMQYLTSYSLLFIIFLICRFIFKNLKSRFYKKHQKFAGRESVPLIGGIVIFSFICLNFEYFNGYILFFSFLVLCLGISSDCDFINSPKIRLILQSSLIIIFVDMLNLNILDLRNEFLNNLISNYYFNVFFITFCLLVLINGSNFIDGLDGLNLGYFLSLLIIILMLSQSSKLIININQIMILFYIITFLFLLNIFNYLYLGDAGSYLIGFLFGYFLLEMNDSNPLISPYFIALLLWYPAFENLFSIIRKKL